MRKFIICGFLALAACQTSPTGRTQFVPMPEGEVDSMGVQAFDDLKAKTAIDHDAATNAYVKCVADAVTAVTGMDQQWEVVVFQSDEINAFALPGGKIGVYTGLLKVANSPDQVATVLGHEVAHVYSQHGRERISDQLAAQGLLTFSALLFSQKQPVTYKLVMAGLGLGAQYGILLPFSRAQESEADIVGLRFMAKAGFDPHQAITLWDNMSKSGGKQPPAWFSDHPSNSARIEQLQAHMDEAVNLSQQAAKHPACRRP